MSRIGARTGAAALLFLPVVALAVHDLCDGFGSLSEPSWVDRADTTVRGTQKNQYMGFAIAGDTSEFRGDEDAGKRG